jgi:hypothetical protein
MQRDYSKLPDDENGDALWHAVQNGLTLGREHRVRFFVAFSNYANAFRFGCFLLRQGYWAQVNEAATGDNDEVLVEMGLDATHGEISGAEVWLREHAAEFEGRATGWEIREPIERPVKVESTET